MNIEVLIFQCDDQHFALPAASVKSVLRAVALSSRPSALDTVVGMVNIRGKITPVVDCRKLLGFCSSPIRPSDHFIVVDTDGIDIALHVDRALELLNVMIDDELNPKRESSSVEMVAKTHFGLVRVIDSATLFDEPSMKELTTIASSITATELAL